MNCLERISTILLSLSGIRVLYYNSKLLLVKTHLLAYHTFFYTYLTIRDLQPRGCPRLAPQESTHMYPLSGICE